MADKIATFGIKIDAQSNSDAAAKSVTGLRDSILSAQDRVKNFQSSLRLLKGNSDEVKAAKEKLRGAIDAERNAISQATLKLGDMGKTLKETTAKQKDASSGWESARSILTAMGSSIGAITAGFVTAAGAVGALSTALGAFTLAGANTLRTQNLFREAAMGSAENAHNFGDQIEYAASRVSLSREQLQKLSIEQYTAFRGMQISGQGIVDAFTAVAQVTDAMGDSAGRKFEDLLERGKRFGRFFLNQTDLEGTGLKYNEVVADFAKKLGVTVEEARSALYTGRVKLTDAAGVLRQSVEAKFADLNARKFLDLGNLARKFHENLVGLTSGVDLTPIAKGVGEIIKFFNQGSKSGAIMKDMITRFGKVMSDIFVKGLPYFELFFLKMVELGLRLELKFYDLRDAVRGALKTSAFKDFGDFQLMLTVTKDILSDLIDLVIKFVGVAAKIGGGIFQGLSKAADGLDFVIKHMTNPFELKSQGADISKGIANGIKDGAPKVSAAITDVSQGTEAKFRQQWDMHSPSKKTEKWGHDLASPIATGVKAEKEKVASAFIAPTAVRAPALGGGQASAPQSGPVTVTLTLSFPNARDGGGISKEVESPEFQAKITRVLERVFRSQGMRTQTSTSEVT